MLAAVRVRGQPDTPDRVERILSNLGLEQKNHAVLLPANETFVGMLERAKDVVTYGDIDTETAVDLLKERGETDHGALVETVDELGYDSIEALVEAVEDGEVSLSDLRDNGWRNVVRLTPPSKGYSDTRRHYAQGGSLGNRGEAMDDLLQRMQ